MNKNRILTVVLVLLLLGILLAVMKYFTGGNGMLVSPGVGKIVGQPTALPTSMPVPQTPSFNPPKEIQYSSGTDLRQELESINPQVLDSDFE